MGPNLAKVASRLDRQKLLESLVNPGAQIADGYGVVVITLKDGKSVSGTVASESADSLLVKGLDGVQTKVAKGQIQERTAPASTMPPMGAMLTAREIRDVVEFLGTLK